MFDSINRREFMAAGAAAAVVASAPRPIHAAPSRSSGMSFIHLFLPGGWPCNNLWDPKPYTPFRRGMRGSELTGIAHTIDTSVPGMHVTDRLLITSEFMNRGTIVRSLLHDTIDHAGAQQRMLEALTFGSQPEEKSLREARGWRGDAYDGGLRTGDLASLRELTLTQAMLAAVNGVAAGVSRVRVSLPFEPYAGFDLHEFDVSRCCDPAVSVDLPIASTILKLEELNLLDRTILCISSEFNRTIAGRPAAGSDLNTGENLVIESERDYGFHAHFAEANSIVLFGGPFKRGFVYGKTGPRHPMRVVENPVTLGDIHATIAVALGETPREGRVIEDLFA